jgi:hypothetical protein
MLFGSFSYDEIQYGFTSTNATLCLKKENFRPILLELNNNLLEVFIIRLIMVLLQQMLV